MRLKKEHGGSAAFVSPPQDEKVGWPDGRTAGGFECRGDLGGTRGLLSVTEESAGVLWVDQGVSFFPFFFFNNARWAFPFMNNIAFTSIPERYGVVFERISG